MKPGYITSGFTGHRLTDAAEILADLGYRAIGITLDWHTLDPFRSETPAEADRLRPILARLGLEVVVETGARFLLDPRRKHQPTLLSTDPEGRARRLEFLRRSLELAARLGATAFSFWSGATDDGSELPESPTLAGPIADRLRAGIAPLLARAEKLGVRLAFEPEPGMAVATLAHARPWLAEFASPWFGLTVDVGHLHCQREGTFAELLAPSAGRVFNLHLDDSVRDLHDHLAFGTGDLDFTSLFAALASIDYRGPALVELSRHAHDAVRVARASRDFLARHGVRFVDSRG
jgi:sugar phosphate isomerase/epimerase